MIGINLTKIQFSINHQQKKKYISFYIMRIVISGGGIAGLTLALASKKAGYIPIVIEQRDQLNKPSFGGGIGLWPPSQQVLENLGILPQLKKCSSPMPSATYYNSKGYILGHPTSNFGQKFKVECLERQHLLTVLYNKCVEEGVKIRAGAGFQWVQSHPNGVRVGLTNGQEIDGDWLLGCDGIGSKVRDFVIKEYGMEPVTPFHCQYAYFRAVVDVTNMKIGQSHKHGFESWGQRRRFGYVPLHYPKTFWFVAIPIGQSGLQKFLGSHTCSQTQKQWILQQFRYWQSPISIPTLISSTPASTILRTDICKIKNVTSFPWYSKNRNIVILGDAANATAPNLAQGAGLAIESAWDFVSMVDIHTKKGLDQYMEKRRKRAETVQGMADMVAKTGQLPTPYSNIRDFFMRYSTYYLKLLQQRIFEQSVRHSVGGNSGKLHWLPPNIPSHNFHKNLLQNNCILGSILGEEQFHKLANTTKKFRSSFVGYGNGNVSVKVFPFASLIGLPSSMNNAPFGAYCQTYCNRDGTQYQKWTRVFGQGRSLATKYSTIHRSTPSLGISKTGSALTQTLGLGPDIFRFGYVPQIWNNTIHYLSQGLWFRSYKLPIPNFLLPTSSWQQKQTENGWYFDGRISLPKFLGGFNLMTYNGFFQPKFISKNVQNNKKRVIIAGGTGMIGEEVNKVFYQNGWNVEVLTRNVKKDGVVPYIKYHQWNPSQYFQQRQIKKLAQILKASDLIINLSGQNPGSGLWTKQKKQKIIQSRLQSIRLISEALRSLKQKRPQYLQASAAGIYGNGKSEILEDDHQPGTEATFRTQTCKQIQNLTKEVCADAGILRIGHVFCSNGGLLPSIQMASRFRAKKFGRGGQYVPWVHIEDLANSLVHIANNRDIYKNKTINIASPDHKTYDEILSQLAKVKGRRGCIIPVPQKLLRLFLGQISSVIFDNQRMHPKLLLSNGFEFKFAKLNKSLTSRSCL